MSYIDSRQEKIAHKLLEAKKCQIILSNDEDLKKEGFKLRYQMLTELHPPQYHAQLLKQAEKQEQDEYDRYARYCFIRLEDKIIGTGRVILGQGSLAERSFKIYQYSHYFYPDFSYYPISIAQIAEFSRLFVLPEYRNSGVFLAILKGRIELCAQYHISHIFLDAEPRLVSKYKEYGLEYSPISKEYTEFGLCRRAYFVQLETFLQHLYLINKPVWEFISEQGQYYPLVAE